MFGYSSKYVFKLQSTWTRHPLLSDSLTYFRNQEVQFNVKSQAVNSFIEVRHLVEINPKFQAHLRP